ncbi:hypothetical protein HJC23_013309 [Cyclotella cryptica]|uniref:MRH domain-containing protein n=1 Tax=Cyclotella cryptica TaxID=29204 RepID=A0ABD3Q180_9STRA|eukprot:CCRYP_009716-RA/>CCRYP_009716-RA protein AED:0.03 eAED:0.03 QI:285/1/1/1/0.66/0.5/4/415/1543
MPQRKLLVSFFISLILDLPSIRADKSKKGKHVPIGHGHCTDSLHKHYPAIQLIKHHYLEESYNPLYNAPTDPEEIDHMNIMSACEKQCSGLDQSPYYRGYEIMIGRGCYCLMDEASKDEMGVEALRGGSGGTGEIVGSEESAGFYCYAYVRDENGEKKEGKGEESEKELAVNEKADSVDESEKTGKKVPASPDPRHAFVGKGICRDSNIKYYAAIERPSKGPNHQASCSDICGALSSNPYYRGYEFLPKAKACACLFDESAKSDLELAGVLVGGNGANGEIVGVSEDSRESEAYCYKFVGDRNGKIEAHHEHGNSEIDKDGQEQSKSLHQSLSLPHDSESSSSPNDREETANNANSVQPKHISMGSGLCGDAQGRLYAALHFTNPKGNGPSHNFDCNSLCSQHSSSPHYRGYEAIQGNAACKCLFDVGAQDDPTLADSLKGGNGGEGEITTPIMSNNKNSICFKYVGGSQPASGEQSDQFLSVGRNAQSGGKEAAFNRPYDVDSSPSSSRHVYKFVGEGICLSSTGKWYDAIEFAETIATDCQVACAPFAHLTSHRGFEVTADKFCFCLFDDGTHLDDATVKNYGEGKGEIESALKKEGLANVYCFKYVGSEPERDASNAKENQSNYASSKTVEEEGSYYDDISDEDEVVKERLLHETDNYEFESSQKSESFEPLRELPPFTYSSVFLPHQTHYDFLRFDPFSFSGAPLGGWGRDTRNRIASLPLRLVNGFEGSWHDIKNGVVHETAGDGSNTGSTDGGGVANPAMRAQGTKEVFVSEIEINTDGSQNSQGEARDPDEKYAITSTSKQTEATPHRAPHFIIHDGTGQKYICRVYEEDELIVVSRVDSMFLPAVTIAENGGSAETYDENDQAAKDSVATLPAKDVNPKGKTSFEIKMGGDGKSKFEVKVLHNIDVNINDEEEEVDNIEPLVQTIRSAVTKLLNNIGFEDAAAEFEVLHDHGGVADGDGDAQDVNAMLAQIGMAAAVGAGVEGATEVAASAGIASQKTSNTPTQMTYDQIISALDTLKNVCSQFHLGWWSYEWCHQEDVKQFHVGVSHNEGNGPYYQVQDVTVVGHFNGEVEIIFPREFQSGIEKQGTTMSVTYDSNGRIINSVTRVHTSDDDMVYGRSHHENALLRKKYKNKSLSNRGPIIKQTFNHGEMCEEVGYPRQMLVELRCCTEDEMLEWLKAKAAPTNNKLTKADIPKALLVGVQESKKNICHYTSQVCTPALCPDQEPTVADATKRKTPSSRKKKTGSGLQGEAGDAIATALTTLLGDLDNADIEVYVGDEETTHVLEELMNGVANGVAFADPFKENGFLSNFLKMKSPKKTPSAIEVKEGESVRELLDRTLGMRPCLRKNLGWWTYEFCHKVHVLQYHGAELLDARTGRMTKKIDTSHLLGLYKGSGNSFEDYPNEEEHLHVINTTSSSSELDLGGSRPKPRGSNSPNQKSAGGHGAVYVQEWHHGDVCDHEDVAESVIKGGNIVKGSVERSTTVRYSCGKTWELVDINEDSTCHYVIDVSVPELCQHPLFKAPVIKTQVVKCLPV